MQEFLPSEEAAVRIAEKYIELHGGMPDDAVFGGVITEYHMLVHRSGKVIEKRPDGIRVGYHRVLGGMRVAGPGDTIDLSIGDNGTIIRFLKSWRHLEYAGEREILTASEAVKRLQRGETVYKWLGSLDTIEINNIFLSYYSEVPDVKQDFYEPVWVFRGKDSYGYGVTLPVWAGVVPPKPTSSDDAGVRLTDRDDEITPTPTPIPTPTPTPSDDAVIRVPVSVNAPESISDTFDVTIDVKNVTSMNSGQFDLSFDSSVVNVTGVSAGKIGGTTVPILGWGFMDARKIRVLFKLDGLGCVSGSGYVARIDFETRGSTGGSCVLGMSRVMLVDTEAGRYL
ncbi:MAG: cohesin domain-containing protein [Euryarchaeota archaeon]|nr:cohesin domain-containing protein [Euryarchaeota archaeon]